MCVTALSHSFANERSATVATFRKRGPYQWQAQVRKKGQPMQTKNFETRALAEQWARAIEVEDAAPAYAFEGGGFGVEAGVNC
jgi:hypothetical protein